MSNLINAIGIAIFGATMFVVGRMFGHRVGFKHGFEHCIKLIMDRFKKDLEQFDAMIKSTIYEKDASNTESKDEETAKVVCHDTELETVVLEKKEPITEEKKELITEEKKVKKRSYNRAYYQANKEKFANSLKKWRHANRDKYNAYVREYRKKKKLEKERV